MVLFGLDLSKLVRIFERQGSWHSLVPVETVDSLLAAAC